jgi:hypothetical protein
MSFIYMRNTCYICAILVSILFKQKLCATTYTMGTSGSQSATVTATSGGPDNFYDDGGIGSNYSNNISGAVYTFDCAGGNYVRAKINSITLGTGDLISIYDGSSTSARQIGQVAATVATAYLWVSTTGSLTFEFTTDGSSVDAGWDIDIYISSIQGQEWIGSTNATATASNWEASLLPTSQSSIFLLASPSGGTQPIMNGDLNVFDFRSESGSSFSRSSGNNNVFGNFDMNGTYNTTIFATRFNGGSASLPAVIKGTGTFGTELYMTIGNLNTAYIKLERTLTLKRLLMSTSFGGEFDMNGYNLTIDNTTADYFAINDGDIFYLRTGTLSITSASSIISATATFVAGTGTINFTRNSGNQTIPAATYYNLTISGGSSRVKTLAGNIIVSNNLSISASTEFDVSATPYSVSVGGSWTNSGTFTPRTGTVTYNKAGDQTIGPTTYYNLTISGGSGTKSITSTTTAVTNNLTLDASITLAVGTATASVTGISDINGTLTISTGTLNANGTFDATGGAVTFSGAGNLNLGGATITSLGTTFTPSTGTVNYNRAGDQSIISTTYYNLTIAGGSGTKSITGTTYYGGTADNDQGKLSVGAGTTLAIGNQTLSRFYLGTSTNLNAGTITLNDGTWQATYGASSAFDASSGTITGTGTGEIILKGNGSHNLGTFNAGSGTVSYTRNGDQTVLTAPTYFKLNLANSGTKTLDGATLNVTSSLTIGGTATFSPGANTVNLGGSWINNNTFSGGTSTINFNGGTNQSIEGTSTTTFYNLTNSNSSTGLTLNRGIVVSNTLAMSGATADINLNGFNIDLSSTGTISGESNTDRIYGTSGIITTTRNLSNISGSDVGGMGAILTTAADLGSTTIYRGHAAQSGAGNTSILRYYSIVPTGTTSGLDATLRLNYFENELNLQTEANFALYRSTDAGATWTNRAGTHVAASDYIELSGIDAFSLWTTSNSVAAPLPVIWLNFDAVLRGDVVYLDWSTGSEINNDYFIIERSQDGINYSSIGSIQAAGNSNQILHYSFIDSDQLKGLSFYRIKQVDFDNNHSYSLSKLIDYKSTSFHTYTIFPNPNDGFRLYLQKTGTNFSSRSYIELFNHLGELVLTEPLPSNIEIQELTFKNKLVPGVYTLMIYENAIKVHQDKLILYTH